MKGIESKIALSYISWKNIFAKPCRGRNFSLSKIRKANVFNFLTICGCAILTFLGKVLFESKDLSAIVSHKRGRPIFIQQETGNALWWILRFLQGAVSKNYGYAYKGVENITSCLSFIGELGVSIEGVTSKASSENSNSVASKNSVNSTVTTANVNTAAIVKAGMVAPSLGSDMLSKLPSPFRPSSGRSIPCPGSKESGSSIPSSSNPSAAAGSRKNKMVASSGGQQGKPFLFKVLIIR
ncbi:hypothetical protein CEXT_561071 [Caerostris extrusa]|uniref:LAGLIDADG homing endonuclease n=1 Tax=Caerostris extrusa TaxID=172846 RepID=A0AAV4Y0H5_CAEEX|nr:hypothetical protein CEXT_561071 [Caerostris extrusa]